MEIIPVKYAESTLPENMIFSDSTSDKKHEIVFLVYLIKTENKLILVDAGCETMPGFVMRDFIGPVVALDRIGVSSDDITDVIITHFHHDHIECVKYFKNAIIHIQKDEYELGKSYIPESMSLNLFEDDFEISKNIKAIKIGGHSPGSCIVEILFDDKIYVIAGDECYLRKCLTEKIPTGNCVNKQKSEDFIKKYSNPKYTVLLCHDN